MIHRFDDHLVYVDVRRAGRHPHHRFGHVFLICASGLTGDQMLGSLRERLKNNADIERSVAATELRMITRLRVAKALAS